MTEPPQPLKLTRTQKRGEKLIEGGFVIASRE